MCSRDFESPFFGDKMLQAAESDEPHEEDEQLPFTSMGGMITVVYEAIKSGALYPVLIDCLNDSSTATIRTSKL
jgi:phenylalanine ammonia-lyase